MLRFYTGFSESFMSSGSYSKQELYAAHFFLCAEEQWRLDSLRGVQFVALTKSLCNVLA